MVMRSCGTENVRERSHRLYVTYPAGCPGYAPRQGSFATLNQNVSIDFTADWNSVSAPGLVT
jgi:hypothetical protein